MSPLSVIGLGRMGRPICARLVQAGFEVGATDAAAARQADAEGAGARWGETLDAAVTDADIVLTVLPGAPEVAAIAEPLTAAMAAGSLWIDLSTASPAVVGTISETAGRRDIAVVDAPLGGSPEDARDGLLSSFVGGGEADLDRARPVLGTFTAEVVNVGPHGSGYLTKLLANALWFGQAVATAEALAIAARAGLELDRVQGALAESAAGRGFLAHDAPALVAGDTMPSFSLARCLEQLRSLQRTAADAEVTTEVLDAVAGVHAAALREYGDVEGELLGARHAASRAGVDFGC